MVSFPNALFNAQMLLEVKIKDLGSNLLLESGAFSNFVLGKNTHDFCLTGQLTGKMYLHNQFEP